MFSPSINPEAGDTFARALLDSSEWTDDMKVSQGEAHNGKSSNGGNLLRKTTSGKTREKYLENGENWVGILGILTLGDKIRSIAAIFSIYDRCDVLAAPRRAYIQPSLTRGSRCGLSRVEEPVIFQFNC